MRSLYINIKALYGITNPECLYKKGSDMNDFSFIKNAWLLCENGKIVNFGLMADLAQTLKNSVDEIVNCQGRMILPTFADSHTHLVFAASREEEFELRLKGATYEEIAAAGGGILNSAAKLANMSEDELYDSALMRLHEVISQGTGAIEIKSGYGLCVESELKILRVIKRIKQNSPIPVKATFLGAHAYPARYKNNHRGYLDLIINEMLPEIHKHQLADYMDVFCDRGFFSIDETDELLKEAYTKYGLKAKIHGNELGITGGVQVAVANNALSVDHLEHLGDEEIQLLKNSGTFPVALPNCSFFLTLPYAPVKQMIANDLPVVLASDYNPGSSPSGNMRFVVSLACTQMKLTPEEAFNACTINGAAAMELNRETGSIQPGKRASFIITKPLPSLAYIPYAFGSEWIERCVID